MKLILPAILAVVMIIGAFFYLRATDPYKPTSVFNPSPSPNLTKTYKSSVLMDFTIVVPIDFLIEEKAISVTVKNSEGEIFIGQNGTNFENVDDYISNSRNNIANRIKNREVLNMADMEIIAGTIDSERIYFIMPKDSFVVYIISTKTETLFPVLDQIARSFRYTP